MKDTIKEANKDWSTNNSSLKIADASEPDAPIPSAGEQNGITIDTGVKGDNKGISAGQDTYQQGETTPKEYISGTKSNRKMQNTEQAENPTPSAEQMNAINQGGIKFTATVLTNEVVQLNNEAIINAGDEHYIVLLKQSAAKSEELQNVNLGKNKSAKGRVNIQAKEVPADQMNTVAL